MDVTVERELCIGSGYCVRIAPDVFALDDEEIAAIYTRDLEELFPEARGIVREVVVQRWERGLPYPRPGRYRLQQALERPLGKGFLAGDYLGTWYTETAISTGTTAAQAALDGLGAG